MTSTLGPLTMDEIVQAATVTVDTLEKLRYPCYLFGSAACALYRSTESWHRTPHDIDIVVLARKFEDVEDIKQTIALSSNRFVLKPSGNPRNTYQILYFKVPRPRVGPNRRRRRWGPRKECKVDILLPGTLDLPRIPVKRISWLINLPVAPFKTLILLKLFGWYERRVDRRVEMRARSRQDATDIVKLLNFVMLNCDVMDGGGEWCPSSLHERARDWVRLFIAQKPTTAGAWGFLGFDIEVRKAPTRSLEGIGNWDLIINVQ
ncbi:hypothetical protein BDN72DRAFT_566804 [Pluteus cervinus]|uniref:Uncharacterized protein n=1 Tax=Pluteus cervinus TaxID=181527 RepID=A0ACD3AX31_9AGAR|nr:hypothetical protein BDN72DRAFT_566804 [Pluteus cervinus]